MTYHSSYHLIWINPDITVVIPDGTSGPLTSDAAGQLFRLEAGSSALVADAPLLTIDDPWGTFKNQGSAATTGETSTVAIKAKKAAVLNYEDAEITAEDTAIEVDARYARIYNAGLIDGDRNGVDFANGGESSGALYNWGTISSDSRAVNIGGEYIAIHNYGDIIGTGDQRNGTIYADGGANRYKIVNHSNATIDAGEGNQGAGISLQVGEDQGDIRKGWIYNYGRIEGRGGAEDSSALSGDGIRITSGAEEGDTTFRGKIVNHGEIFSLDRFGDGATAAIRIADGVALDGKIINGSKGVIDGDANGIYFGEAEHDAWVLNYGVIQSNSRAVKIDGSDVRLLNFGDILGISHQEDGTVHVDGTAEDVTIVNYSAGRIIANNEGNGDSIGIGLEIGDEAGDIVDVKLVNHGSIVGTGGTSGDADGSALYIHSEIEDGTTTYRGNILNYGEISADQSETITIDSVNFQGDIINHGQIIAGEEDERGSTAIYIHAFEREATFTGDIVNHDTIDADGGGIYLDHGVGFQGNIVNHGTIQTVSTSIEIEDVSGFTGDIINRGLITNEVNDGIRLGRGIVYTGDIVNHDRIDAANTGIEIGLESQFTGDVTNHGTIEADFDGIRFNVFSRLVGDVTNDKDGIIESGDDGIQLNGDNNVTGDVVNRGKITAEDDGIDLNGGVSLDGSIINEGWIEADDDGIEITGPELFTGTITNRGTITADADEDGNGAALDIDDITLDLTVVNEGTLNGNVLLGTGNDRFDGATGSVNGTIVGGDGDDYIESGLRDDFLVGDVIRRESTDTLNDVGIVIGGNSTPTGADTLIGGAGDDTITGDVVELPSIGGQVFVGNDLIYGGEGNDRIAGDVLEFDDSRLLGAFVEELPEGAGRVGLDTIFGGDGNDVISGDIFGSITGGDGGQGGLPGVDEDGNPINGEDGGDGHDGPRPPVDTIFGGAGDDVIYGDASLDVGARGRLADDILPPLVDPDPDDGAGLGFAGSPGQGGVSQNAGDHISGGDGSDTLIGDAGRDLLGNGGGDDRLYGGDGDDLIIGDAGRDFGERATGGDDTIDGGEGDDRIYGDAVGEDNGNGGDDSIDAGAGQDTVFGGSGADRIDGAEDGDQLYGGQGNDILFGDAAEDFLGARGGDDQLFGGDGDDLIIGDAGRRFDEGTEGGDDTIEGGAGADTIFGDIGGSIFDDATGGDDTLYGGDGNDLIAGDVGDIIGTDSEGGDDIIFGGEGDDFIFGDALNETDGLGGDDSLDGGAGQDTIFGASGDDRIDGGEGGDWIDGGDGADRFVYRAGEGGLTLELVDVIDDFEDGTDLIELVDGLEFGTGAGQAQFIGGSELDGLGSDDDDSILVITDGNGTVTEALAVIDFVFIDNLDANDVLITP